MSKADSLNAKGLFDGEVSVTDITSNILGVINLGLTSVNTALVVADVKASSRVSKMGL